jgi:hypothetical protein
MEVLTGVFLNKSQSTMLDMQKRNVISIDSDSDSQRRYGTMHKAALREKCLFGSLGNIKECLDYFKHKPILNLIDKRLLLGVF